MGINLDWALIIAVILMLVGVAGIFLPFVPGVAIIWLGIVVYVALAGFGKVSVLGLLVLSVLGLAGATAEMWASNLGAKLGGASFPALLGGLVLGTLGLIFFSLPGGIIGSIGGVLLVESVRVKDVKRGLKAGGGWFLGWLLSVVIQLTIALVMIAIFLWLVIF